MPYMKLSNTNQTFTFDDVQIIPQYSDVASRSNCNTSTLVTENYVIDIPLIASPMASICELEMAYEMWRLGGVGIVHRFNTIEEQSSKTWFQTKTCLPYQKGGTGRPNNKTISCIHICMYK